MPPNLLTLQDQETSLLRFRKIKIERIKILQADTGKMGAGVKRTKEKENEVLKTYYQYVLTIHVSIFSKQWGACLSELQRQTRGQLPGRGICG